MTPVSSAALVDLSLALCVILAFVGGLGLVAAPVRWVLTKLEDRRAARELGDRLASAEDSLPAPPKVPDFDHPQFAVAVQLVPPAPEPAAAYSVEDCRRREAECRAMSEDGKRHMSVHMAAAQGTGGVRRMVILGYLEAEACRMRRGKQWADQWALLAEAIEDEQEGG